MKLSKLVIAVAVVGLAGGGIVATGGTAEARPASVSDLPVIPGVPTIPLPNLPTIPGGTPTLPTLPGGVPTVPTLPGGTPTVPTLPGGVPTLPTLPTLPTFPGEIPTLPGGVPTCLPTGVIPNPLNLPTCLPGTGGAVVDPPSTGTTAQQPGVTGSVKVIGKAKVGTRLRADTSALSAPGYTLSYQWFRNGKAITVKKKNGTKRPATKSTYKAVGKDKGKQLVLQVTATKPGASTVVMSATSPKIKKK